MITNKKVDKNPTCVNILKLQRYNFKFFSLEEVVFYEYLIVKARSFKFKSFFHSTETISKEIGIKRTKLESIIQKFKDLGILQVEVKGFPKVKYFTVNFDKISLFLSKIYQSAENGKLSADMHKLLADFYNPLVEIYQKKNNIESISKENNKKELKEGGSDWEAFILLFNNLLLDYKNDKGITQAQLKYNEADLYRAYDSYERDLIITALHKFFEGQTWNKKVADFLKAEPLNLQKVAFIEKFIADEKKYVDSFIKGLATTYNNRREKHSTSKKTYPATNLPINHSIKYQVAELLRCRPEQEITDAFIVYCDQVITGELRPKKFLPYFLSKNNLGEYSVVDDLLNVYNLNYVSTRN